MDEDTKNIIGKGLKLAGQLFESNKNSDKVVQCWLEEHRALRNEIEQHNVSMRYMTIFNITASGTIFSLAFSNNELVALLLVVPILSAILGFIFFFHSKRMSQLGRYIQNMIAPKLRRLLNNDLLLGWEDNIREQESEGYSKVFSLDGVRLATFILTSVIALSAAVPMKLFLQFLPVWLIGLMLTVVLIILSTIERRLWFGIKRSKV